MRRFRGFSLDIEWDQDRLVGKNVVPSDWGSVDSQS